MTKHRMTLLGIALAAAASATTASAYTTYREVYVSPAPAPVVRVETVATPRVVTYDQGYVTYNTYEPRYVERSYVAPSETVVVQADPVVVNAPRYYDTYAYAPSQWGQLIDQGLFNRRGQNDFGR